MPPCIPCRTLWWCIIALKFKFRVLGMSALPLVLHLRFLPCCLFQRNSKQLVFSNMPPFASAYSVSCRLKYPSLSGSLGQLPFFLQSLVRCHLFREVFPDAPHPAIGAHSHLSVYLNTYLIVPWLPTSHCVIIGCSVSVSSAIIGQCLILFYMPGAQHTGSIPLAAVITPPQPKG